ncbi:hypothetical protein GEMRC1_000525 [Eukaryota sp. GEM-RC1]
MDGRINDFIDALKTIKPKEQHLPHIYAFASGPFFELEHANPSDIDLSREIYLANKQLDITHYKVQFTSHIKNIPMIKKNTEAIESINEKLDQINIDELSDLKTQIESLKRMVSANTMAIKAINSE